MAATLKKTCRRSSTRTELLPCQLSIISNDINVYLFYLQVHCLQTCTNVLDTCELYLFYIHRIQNLVLKQNPLYICSLAAHPQSVLQIQPPETLYAVPHTKGELPFLGFQCNVYNTLCLCNHFCTVAIMNICTEFLITYFEFGTLC